MFTKIMCCLCSFMAFIVIFSNNALPWNDGVTHRDLSQYAAESSVLGSVKGDYLKNIGFTKGLKEELIWNTTKDTLVNWLREGALLEDSGAYWQAAFNYARYNNHFHNPLQPWSSAGLTDWVPFTTKSAVLWAQDGTYQTAFPEGDQSWNTIRNLYLLALTSTTDSERQANFAKTFKGLGHQLHLIEDMAQPDHVRNDSHIWDSLAGKNPVHGSFFFETWAQKKFPTLNELKNFAPNPVFPEVPFSISYDGLSPVTQLIDTKQYSQSKTPTVSLAQGLAEYTNANFFSDDTIFAAEKYSQGDKHYFPYPRKTSTNLQAYEDNSMLPKEIWAEDKVKDVSFYISKDNDGETIDYFVRSSYLTNNIKDKNDKTLYYRTFYRDEVCHEDYAQKLIPRAVGYSAGLLNYFFRGQMAVRLVPGGISVKNTSQETMTSGSIAVYYDAYDPNDVNGKRTLLADPPLASPLLSGDEITIPFTVPADNVKQSRYIVVFHGKLGDEEGAVIGKVTSLQIYYASKRESIYKIYRMDIDGSEQTLVYDNQDPNLYIGKLAPSPDGKTLAFVWETDATNPLDSTISLLDLTNGTAKVLTNGDWPNWSPDGTKIIFQRETGQYLPDSGDVELFTIELNPDLTIKQETQLTNVPGTSYCGQPAWSPDGNTIAYVSVAYGPDYSTCPSSATYKTIYVMNTSGNSHKAVSCFREWGSYDDAPSWSPDGKEIAFTRRRFSSYDENGQWKDYKYMLYKTDIVTQTITKITDSPGDIYSEFTPVWSQDGKTVAIGSDIDGDFDIWLVDPNGGGYLQNLTDANTDIDVFPVFGWR